MAGLSILGSVGMLLAVGVALVKLILMDNSQPTEAVHRPTSFTKPVVAILDIIFAYGGQVRLGRGENFLQCIFYICQRWTSRFILEGAVSLMTSVNLLMLAKRCTQQDTSCRWTELRSQIKHDGHLFGKLLTLQACIFGIEWMDFCIRVEVIATLDRDWFESWDWFPVFISQRSELCKITYAISKCNY